MPSTPATARPSAAAAPLLRWAGGKRRLLPVLTAALPREFGTYVEPFFGGGALLFDLAARGRAGSSVVNDLNPALVTLYRTLAADPEGFIVKARALRDEYMSSDDQAGVFYRWREAFNELDHDGRVDVDAAVLMLLLNRTCFNGLWRVNGKGGYNVPWGRLKNPLLVDEPRLRSAASVLARSAVLCGDYRAASAKAQTGDLVYFDPPYIPHSPTASFSKYTADDFTRPDQEALATEVDRVLAAGATVMLSNADDEAGLARRIFGRLGEHGDGFALLRVSVARSISAKATSRGAVHEVLGVSWGPDDATDSDALQQLGVSFIPASSRGTVGAAWQAVLPAV